MRILVGAVGHESNTFTPFLTTRDDFFVRYGSDVLDRPLYRSSIQGIVTTLQAHDVDLVPTVAAGAMPGGVVERSAYETFKQAILEKAHDVDGACLYLHGAMRAEGVDYCENELLRELRVKLGPDVPVTIALDMHANIVAESVVFASIWDVDAVEACATAGVGQKVTLSIGGKLDTRHGTPLEVTGQVRLLTDGHYYQGGIRRPPMRAKSGPIAVLNVDGVDVILSSTRLSFVDPVQLRSLGLEPLDYRLVVLKRGYLTAPFQAISERSILAFSPGATNCQVAEMAFHRVNRPIYPLDFDATWLPNGLPKPTL